uniref:Uncharacterized protein n=1 Tax=Manihot esculenta TaxID=3983 RepID=A0A2C9UZ61_MANES
MRKWQRKRLGGVLAGTGDSSTFLSFHMVASSIPLPSSKWIYCTTCTMAGLLLSRL